MLDGAHNPGGLAALAEALPEFVAGRRLVACLAVLDDKDAAAMLRMLLPLCDAVVATRAQTPALAAARHVGVALRPAAASPGPSRSCGEPRRPSGAPVRWRARTASRWPPARST